MDNKNIDSKLLIHVFLKKKKYLCTLSLGFLFVTVATVMMFADLLENAARYLTRLHAGSDLYERLKEDMRGVSIELYLFNITNERRFSNGEDDKLILQEVGPFVYRQMRTHKNLSIDDEAHVLRYTPSNNNTFDLEASVGDPSNIYLTLPDIPLLTIASKISNEYSIFKYLVPNRSPVRNISVQDYLWGYEDSLVTMGNTFLPKIFHFNKLGLLDRFFDPLNYKPLELDATDANKFAIKKLDGVGGLKGLKYNTEPSYCNTFNDTFEGVIFPFKMSPERNVRLYHNIYCRMFDLEYVRTEDTEYGSQGLVYRIGKDAFNHNEKNDCLCPAGGCVDGVSDLSTCFYGFPLGLSLAHFLYANDSKLTEKIEGMNPDETLHGSRFAIDKSVGVSLETSFTLQYNLMISDLSFLPSAKRFSNIVLPFVWIKVVQPPLPDDVVLKIKILNLYMPKIMLSIEIMFITIGIFLFVYSYKKTNETLFKNNRIMIYHDPAVIRNAKTELPLIVDREK